MSGAAVDLAHLARYTGGDAALNAEICACSTTRQANWSSS